MILNYCSSSDVNRVIDDWCLYMRVDDEYGNDEYLYMCRQVLNHGWLPMCDNDLELIIGDKNTNKNRGYQVYDYEWLAGYVYVVITGY